MRSSVALMQQFTAELQRRSVFHVAGVYGAVAFVLLQAADLIFPALMLSENTYRLLVWVVLAGFPVALWMAWIFDLTAQGVKRTVKTETETADAEQPTKRSLTRKFQMLSLVVIITFLTTAGGLGAARSRLSAPRADDGRIAVAVFPFRSIGASGSEWSEGIADLLTTALDGTVGLRVVDPWALWQRLRTQPGAAATSPDPTTASALGREVGARRVVLGSTVIAGNEVRLSVRIYDPRLSRPLETFAESGAVTDMPGIVQRLAVQVLTRVWDDQSMPGVPRLEPNVTQSPEALKAYLAAKAAMRHGQVDSAVAAIDRAIALDSTFALALVDAVGIRTWYFYMTGRPYSGFFELLGLARQHGDSLSERSRLRLEATLASVRTEGANAASALRRIIEIDSTDLAAWSFLTYVHNVYGWQYGASARDAAQAAERVVALDSSYVPGLVSLAWIRVTSDDTVDTRRLIERLAHADTSAPMARGVLRTLRVLRSDERTFRTQLRLLAGSTEQDWLTSLRYMRPFMPARAEMLLEELRSRAQTSALTSALAEQIRLSVAEGNITRADSLLKDSGTTDAALMANAQRLFASTALLGIGNPQIHSAAAAWLHRSVPPDSMMAFFNIKPVWWTGWMAGAYHAQNGDTLIARRYQRAIGTLPGGGSPSTYREALQSDIEARIAERRGDATRALAEARLALENWSVHSDNQLESMPEPAMRFHLASLLARTGAPREAEPLFRSLLPPTTWLGFLSARAALELGDIEAARGDAASAATHYSMALRLWERGGNEAAGWRAQVESRLSRLVSRVQG